MSTRSIRNSNLGAALVVLAILGALFFWEFGAGLLANESDATKAASDQFSEARVTDKAIVLISWRGCGSDDSARFTVAAKNAQGKDVEFYVCTGFWKGGTIRAK